MTQAEKEEKALEMQACAQALTEERRDRTGYNRTVEEAAEVQPKEAKFFKKMQKDVYLESNMTLEDRMNRNKHYRDRKTMRDDD